MADILVLQSRVKALIKKKKCNTAGDLAPALSKEVEALVTKAAAREKANGRKTVRAGDL